MVRDIGEDKARDPQHVPSMAASGKVCIPFSLSAADADGSIAKVEFFQGTNLVNTDSVSPYSFNWTGVPAGGYVLTAKATDNLGAVTTSSAVNISVTAPAAALYFIHPDHLDTPRVITNASQQVVWRWDNDDPFGGNTANQNPGGLGNFVFNPRFPGQYFDKETNLHYNYFRDYSPEIGRYIESDLIGLRGGLNTYAYVGNNPLRWFDAKGLLVDTPTKPPETPTKPPIKPPVSPPGPGGGSGPQTCPYLYNLDLGGRLGPFFGWPKYGYFICFYYCGPPGSCPANPDDYVVSIPVEGYVLLPGSHLCPPTITFGG